MSAMELQAKARELKELKRMAEELDAEITAAEDAIKAAMGDQEQVIAGEYKISWKPVTSARFDSTAFKKDFPDVAAEYTKQTTIRRFCVA
jgi:predicted phage-related endonuclease